MNRKQFLKNILFGITSVAIAPSLLASTTIKSPPRELDEQLRASVSNDVGGELFPPELVNFAWWFSENYRTLSTTGIVETPQKIKRIESTLYYSEKGNFQIRYFDIICDKYGEKFKTPTRIGHDTKVMEFSKDFFTKTKGITKNSVFYMVLWTWHVLQCDNDLTKCDIETLQYYLQLGLPAKDVHFACINAFKSSPSEHNKLRLQKIEEFINNKQRSA